MTMADIAMPSWLAICIRIDRVPGSRYILDGFLYCGTRATGQSQVRPLVLVATVRFNDRDGMATAVRHNLNPIVVVLNNRGYGTERHIHDGPFNDLLPGLLPIPDVSEPGSGLK